MGKFFIVFLAIFLYIFLWFGVVAVAVVATGGDEEGGLVIALGTLVIFPITLLPFMQIMAKRVFCFKGIGTPVSETALRSMILNINDLDAKILDYKFSSNEIKYPIMNSILRNGWDVRFALW